MNRCAIKIAALLALMCKAALSAGNPMPPDQAAANMVVPQGFLTTLFAGEPDIVQPMSITFDDRGRIWVVECRSYPKWLSAGTVVGPDRILVLEDVDQDGRFDTKKIFFDNGVNLTSVEYGFGGIFVIALPNLIFIPDADGDDVPDGPPTILIDGFDLNGKHNVANGLTWGPDGWLYGCNGILSNSKLGKPGTPENQRIPMNCGIWRYHPVKQTIEVVAHGTTNPWGLAFDQRGEAFLTNCVIEHAFHVVPGSRFKRMFGQDFNPRTFELMQTCADHIHWAGGTWEGSRNATGKHGEAGGGHAHSGAMIYLGNHLPSEYRNCLMTLNIHGQRINRDKLERNHSGYIAKHREDFAKSNDPFFRGVCIKQGLDGAVYFTDWSDTGECHNYDDATIHRENGRIFRVMHTGHPLSKVNLSKATDQELLQTLVSEDAALASRSRRILQERAARGVLAKDILPGLAESFREQVRQGTETSTTVLQLLWSLHAITDLQKLTPELFACLKTPNDTLRGWIVRLLLENQPNAEVVSRFAKLANDDASLYVRLQLASGLQRLSLKDRYHIAEQLVQHQDCAADNNLTLMIWYGIEPLLADDNEIVLSLLLKTRIPKLRSLIARHLATYESPKFPLLLRWLEERQDSIDCQQDILRGIHTALEGRRNVAVDAHWQKAAARFQSSSDRVVNQLSYRISLILGSDVAYQHFAAIVSKSEVDFQEREQAIADLVATRRPEVANILLHQLKDRSMRTAAIRGLAAFAHDEAADQILSIYDTLTATEKLDAISTLTAREKTALALLRAIDSQKIDKQDLSEFDIRQLYRFKDPDLKKLVKTHFEAKPSSTERVRQIALMKSEILAGNENRANARRGRTVFQKNCASCHVLFDDGRQVGPDLTGAQRTDLDYILVNVMDPSALVGHAYRVTVLQLFDGRVIHGIVKSEDTTTITLQTASDRIVVPKQDVEAQQLQSVSMMPEGLLHRMPIQDIRDLIKYLGTSEQVPAE